MTTTLREDQYTFFDHISLIFYKKEKYFRKKAAKKIETHFKFRNFFPKIVLFMR